GRTDNSGSITITAPVTTHAGYNTLSLRSGGSISETATGAVSVTNLAVQATGGASLAANASAVSSVAASSAAGSLALLDALPLTVTTVDGVAGINTNGSALLESSIANTLLTVNQPVASATSFIEFTFDNMTLASTVSAAANELVELLPFSAGQFIDLGGTNTVGTLGLSNAELNEVSAGTLQIGDAVSGSITISAAIDVSAKVGTLDLETGGGITEKAGTVTVANLAIRAVNAVSMPQANDVTTGALAADVTGAGQGFTFTDANDLTIGTADGLNGATTNGGAITVDTAGNLTVNQNVSAGAATISLTAGGAESLLTSAAAISNSGGNTITIAANRMALGAAPASSITAAGGGRVILIATAAGRPINLGPTSDPTGSLNLSSAEVGTVSTTGVLQIGSGIEGDVSVGAPIGPINALTIDTAGGIGGISGAA